jgi:hypothetical protein
MAATRLRHVHFSEAGGDSPQEIAGRRNRRSSGHFWRFGQLPPDSATGFGGTFATVEKIGEIVAFDG